MSREIKFRVWDRSTRKWLDATTMSRVATWRTDDYPAIGLQAPQEAKSLDQYSPRQMEFQLYTGLKDKNGVEIYEGDILKEDSFDNGEGVYQVKYLNNGFWLSGRDANEFDFGDPTEMEVIGNIHCTPELLESHS